MWQCSECEYFNDDFDGLCAKCGAAPATEAGAANLQDTTAKPGTAGQPGPAVAGPTTDPDETPAVNKPRGGDQLLLAIAIVVVIAICIVGYKAYSSGRLPGATPKRGTRQGQGSASNTGNDQASPAHFARVENLEDGLVLPAAQSKKLATYTAGMEQAWTALADRQPVEVQPGQLSAESLAELTEIGVVGNGLLTTYQGFEAYIAETNSPHLNEAAVLMRSQFGEALGFVVATVSNYRAHDLNAIHEAYLLADSVPGAVEEHGFLDGQLYRQMWVDARHSARQIELDLQYGEYYRQLSAHYDVLEQVHIEFSGVLKQIPPTKVRSGTIGKDARDFLDALDTYATVVEGFAIEFEGYALTLENIEQSDKLERYIVMNRDLAQEDHMFCFMETYMMYAKDKNLDHPVYANLDAHYAFVQETWPKLASSYEGVFRNYEQEWLRFWRPDLLKK